MDILKILEFLNHSETQWSSRAHERIENKFDIQPAEFLRFSELDLAANCEHSLINALSNAKRALDSQVDTLLIGFDIRKLAKSKMWGFPKKIELMQQLGIIAPRVLNKINRIRNLMEHEFVKPKHEVVEDFVDIVSLFLACTDKYIYDLPGSCEMENYSLTDFWLRMNLDLKEHVFSLEIVPNEGKNEEAKFKSNDPDYMALLKGYLKAGNAY